MRLTAATAIWRASERLDGDDTSLKQLSREVDDLVVQRQYGYPGKERGAPSRRVRVSAGGLVKYGF